MPIDWPTWLDAQLATSMQAHGVPGAAIAVLNRGVIHHAWAGVADLDSAAPVTAQTPFMIGSTTKALTATLVMQLVEAGRLDLDAPVRSYLPEFRLDGPSEAISTRHLLAHTSGIKGDFFPDVGEGDDALALYMEALRSVPVICEPGRFYSYCNAGYPILGRLCEVITGAVWDDLLHDRVFAPLGMTRSASPRDRTAALGTAVGYDRVTAKGHSAGARMGRATGPAGTTVACTAPDLMRFVLAHMEAGPAGVAPILSPETVAAMRQPQVSVPGGLLAEAWGLGWMLMGWNGVAQFGHDGATAGTLSLVRAFPERGAAVVLQSNAGAAGGFIREVASAVFQELVGVSFPEPPAPDGQAIDLNAYVGRYERYFAGVEVVAEAGELVFRPYNAAPAPDTAPGTGPVFRMQPRSRDVFVQPPPTGPAPVVAVFMDFDADGRPGFLFSGARALKRVEPA